MKEPHTKMEMENENLNAFLDAELGPEETIAFKESLLQNPAQQAHLDELRRVRLIAQCALYKQHNQSPVTQSNRLQATHGQGWRFLSRSVVAGLLITVGFLIGWSFQTSHSQPDLQSYLSTGKLVLQPIAVATDKKVNAIYHVSTANPEKMRGALDEIEILLGVYAKTGRIINLEIIAHAEGLGLLRADISPLRERVHALQSNYPNIRFLACGKTIEHLQLGKNMRKVHLLPGVTVVPSALDQVILRLQDGWSYIRV